MIRRDDVQHRIGILVADLERMNAAPEPEGAARRLAEIRTRASIQGQLLILDWVMTQLCEGD